MTVIELGEEYNNQAIFLENKIEDLKEQLKHNRGIEWKKLQIKIKKYESMYDDCCKIANKLQNYYGQASALDKENNAA